MQAPLQTPPAKYIYYPPINVNGNATKNHPQKKHYDKNTPFE